MGLSVAVAVALLLHGVGVNSFQANTPIRSHCTTTIQRCPSIRLFNAASSSSSNDVDENGGDVEDGDVAASSRGSGSGSDDSSSILSTSTVTIDDGGSDLTDRFKYKVCKLH